VHHGSGWLTSDADIEAEADTFDHVPPIVEDT
jgi:hypothetical protein